MANMTASMAAGSMAGGIGMGSPVGNPYANYMPQLSHHTSYSSQYCNGAGDLSHYDPMSARHTSSGWYGSNPTTDPRLASKLLKIYIS